MTREKRVLVVEDDESIRNLIGSVLVAEGYEVRVAPHGPAVLELAAAHRPDVILLDMRPPAMDGVAFAHAYRRTNGPHAAIVVLTTVGNAAEAVDSMERAQADGFLAKPFDLDVLVDVVGQSAGARLAAIAPA